jgi:hypothetical protein
VAADTSLMERVAATRLRRFERLVAVAERSDSPIWRRLARRAARAALRDCLLAATPTEESRAAA